MTVINQVRLVLPAKSINESYARIAAAALAAQFDPTVEQLADVKTAVSEAVTNAIVHAYRDRKDGKIYITMKLTQDGRIVIGRARHRLRHCRRCPGAAALLYHGRPARSAAAWAFPLWRPSWIRCASARGRGAAPP